MKRTALLLLLILAADLFAQEKPVAISGYVFGDFYSVVTHHDPEVEGMNGVWLRRAYLTFDRALSDELSARLRFEMNQPGDFRTSATLEPYVKDAYVRWRRSRAMELFVGIAPTPATETVESVWGYRALEKTPLDLQRVVSTRDLGVALLGAYGRTRYHLQAGNGSGTGAETNEGKKLSGAFSLLPTASTVLEVYADHEQRPGGADRMTLQGFGAIRNDRFRAGLQYARQIRRDADDFDLASLFGVYEVNDAFTLIGRVDRQFDPNPEGERIAFLPFDPTRESTLFIAAVDWKVHRNVSIIPNVEYVRYDGGGEDDLLPRVTFYFTF